MTHPIEPQNYQHGVNVIDFGDIRVARGLTRRPATKCNHMRLVYDEGERRIWCQDCETDVEAFDAFSGICQKYNAAIKRLAAREEAVKEAEQKALISRAAKVMDDYWRQKTLVPCCPHCDTPLLPSDVIKGLPRVGKDFALARRKREVPPT